MVERSRRNKEDEMDDRATRMVLATAALSAVVALLAAPANAYFPEGDGVNGLSAQSQVRQPTQSVEPGTIPYLSHGIGVDESLFAGQPSETLAAPASSASVALDPAIETAIESRSGDSAAVAAPTIPYLSHGVGVDESQFAGRASQVDAQHAALGHNAVASLPHGVEYSLFSEPQSQPLGLTGDSAPTRRLDGPATSSPTYPSHVIGAGGSLWDGRTLPQSIDVSGAQPPQVTATSSGDDIDWTAFGAGAGMVALLAAGLGGVLLTMRRRHTVGLP